MANSYAEIYQNGTYLKNNPTWDAEDSVFKAGKIESILTKHSIAFTSVCEVGCGAGEVLVSLSKKFPANVKLLGLDISPDAINIAKEKETAQIKFTVKDIRDTALSVQFDLILVLDVIEHVENYFEFLRAVAARGRYTVFHIPLDMSTWSLFRENMLIEAKERVGHIHVFTEDFIISVLRDCGFTIIDRLYTEPILRPASLKQRVVELTHKLLFKLNQRFCSKTMGGTSLLILAERTK